MEEKKIVEMLASNDIELVALALTTIGRKWKIIEIFDKYGVPIESKGRGIFLAPIIHKGILSTLPMPCFICGGDMIVAKNRQGYLTPWTIVNKNYINHMYEEVQVVKILMKEDEN